MSFFLLTGCAGVLPGENEKILKNLSGEYFTIADAYAKLERYETALTYYSLAMRDKNYYAASLYESARMNALLLRWDEATKTYEKLLIRDPENKDILVSLAYVTAMSGNLLEAQTLYENLLVAHGYDEQLHENYIRVLIAQEKHEQALTALKTYKELFPEGASYDVLLPLIHEKIEEPQEIEETEEIIEVQKIIEPEGYEE